MGKIKIGINGFGRIGRMVLSLSMTRTDLEVVAINDLLDINHLAYLLKYDSVHGKINNNVSIDGNSLNIDGQKIQITSEKDPKLIGWDNFGVDAVLECTGIFTTLDMAKYHIDGGAPKVVISAPSKDAPMYVMGVNHNTINKDDLIISNASCTTNCLAPPIKVLNDNFGVEEALMTTVHAVTATQFTVDGPSKKDFRAGRSSLLNIIPASTGAAKAVTKVIPSLQGKITGMAFRVPTANVSVVDLCVNLKNKASYEHICSLMKEASESVDLKGVLAYTEDMVVSSDFISDEHTSIFDAKAGLQISDTFIKVISWYDNEWGYANKIVDMIIHMNNTLK